MTFTVRFRRTAELDIQGAQSWYEEQQAGLAEEFNREVGAVMARLAEAPLIYPVAHREVRRAVVAPIPLPGLVSGLGFGRPGVGLHAWQG